MARFDVYINKAAHPPYMLQYQSELHDNLKTRIVIPLYPKESLARTIMEPLSLIVEIDEKNYILMVSEMAAVHVAQLGKKVTSMESHHYDIIRAADFLFQGF